MSTRTQVLGRLRTRWLSGVPVLRPTILSIHEHDTKAFTQGLAYAGGKLYESTGLQNQSSVRRLSLNKPEPEICHALNGHWGEGIAVRGDELVQLTWKSEFAQVYGLPELEPRRALEYRGLGWGLASYGNGFVMTDGSARLIFRDSTFRVVRTRWATARGLPLRWLNDLEYARGLLYVNRLGDHNLYEIEPHRATVRRIIDCSELVDLAGSRGAEDLLNGIAFVAEDNAFVLTGKRWSKLFLVQIDEE